MAIATPAFAAPDAAALKTRLETLRARVGLLRDHDEIENLQTAYGFYFDKSLWGEVADLFADDGLFEYGQMGVYVGKAHIRKAWTLFSKEAPRGWQAEQPHTAAGASSTWRPTARPPRRAGVWCS